MSWSTSQFLILELHFNTLMSTISLCWVAFYKLVAAKISLASFSYVYRCDGIVILPASTPMARIVRISERTHLPTLSVFTNIFEIYPNISGIFYSMLDRRRIFRVRCHVP